MTDNLFQEPDMTNAVPVAQDQDQDDDSETATGWFSEDVEKLESLLQKTDLLLARVETLTGAVNQFGQMLDFMVNSVAGIGQQFKAQGIGGLLGMLGGKGE